MRQRATLLFCCALYLAAFHFAYTRVLSNVYAYEGFSYDAPLNGVIIAWSLALLPAAWLPIQLRRPSEFVYWVLYLLVIVPLAIVPIYRETDVRLDSLLLSFAGTGCFAAMRLVRYLPLLPLNRPRLTRQEYGIVIAGMSLCTYAMMFYYLGLHLSFSAWHDLYDVRSEYVQSLSDAPRIASYAAGWQAYVVNPLVIATGLVTNRKRWIVAGIVGQAIVFSFTGFKTVLFSPLFLIATGMWCQAARFGYRAALTMATSFFFATLAVLAEISKMPFALLADRLTALPGLLSSYYYHFFSTNPKLMLSHSILSRWIENPYAIEPPRLIGAMYFNNPGMYANANLFADAFANFGVIGMLVFSLVLAMVLWVYDCVCADVNFRLACVVLGMPAIALANAALLTSILTHGIALAIVLMYFTPPQIEHKREWRETHRWVERLSPVSGAMYRKTGPV